METQGNEKRNNPHYSLIPIEDFKVLLGIDDREDKIVRFCLEAATFAIEQYCKRRLRQKKHTEFHVYSESFFCDLQEYPVRKIVSISNEGLGIARSEDGG